MAYTFVNVKVKQSGLTVTTSDAAEDNHPTNNVAGTPDEEGRQFYFRPVRIRETKWVLYCTKLGAALARELKKANKDIVIQNEVLTDLPKGYKLFEHVKHYVNEPKKYRTDTYLLGFGSIRFRSPAEFEDHLLWLASDQSTDCICKYCSRKSKSTQSTPQRSNQQTPQKSSVEKNEQGIRAVISSPSPVTTSDQVVSNTQILSSTNHSSKSSNIQLPSSANHSSKSSNMQLPSSTNHSSKSSNMQLPSSSNHSSQSSNMQLPSSSNHSSRNGEIVWIKTSLVLSETYLEELKNSKVKIEHWPGYVVEQPKCSKVVNNAPSGSLVDNLYYKVQPLNVAGTQKASEEQIVPWLLLSSQSLVEKIYKLRDNSSADKNKKTSSLMHVVNLFCSAYDTARRISKTYSPLDPYKYMLPPLFLSKIEDPNERQLLQEMEKYTHYKTLCFGTEILKENDYVRINDSESKGDSLRIFKINTIYENFDNKILVNGDIYLKSFTRGDKVGWNKLNDEDKEYFIELEEVSGRYYDKCPYVNRSMEINEAISFEERKELIERQETNKSAVSKQAAKHSMYFDKTPNTPTKKLKIRNERTTPQQHLLEQNNQQEKDVSQNNHINHDKQDYMDEEDDQPNNHLNMDYMDGEDGQQNNHPNNHPNNDELDCMNDKDVRQNSHLNNDELDYMDVREVQQKIDPIIISPSIPFLDESEDEISEKESSLFEMLSNNPENPQLMTR